MEAVPRLHMLWFALKSSPEGTSFANLKKYIAEFYQEDPEAYSKDVYALETLRNQAMHPPKDGNGCKLMKRYYCQLHSLLNRFPQLNERAGIFTFAWKDMYQNNIREVTDMHFEMAAVLFNIAASHTQVGASVTRGDVDGMKTACTHFQCAAWSFGELRERYANVNSGGDFMTPELLVFMQQVSYAQAQECILEKSLIDNRKPNIVAKVTAQIIVYYGAALAALLTGGDDGPVAQVIESSVYKLWKKYVRFKISYLNCILFLYQGQHSEEQQKMGERVTLYQAAWDKLEEARKESKGLPDQKEINESLVFTADVVEAKRKNAKNENEFIYHESVPELSNISAVQGANLVNGISFSVTDPEVAGEDIFARLVPMQAHEASSIYSEEKAKLLRKYGGRIEEKDAELATFMSSLTLDNLNINEEKANKIPQGIVDRCAALNANKSAIPDLIAAMSQLAEICSDVEINLKEISGILAEEERQEQEFQAATGVKRTPNAHITELTREYQKYNEAHSRAGESNDTLRKAMELHVNNLKILARPLQEIQQSTPKLSTELNTTEIFRDVKLIVNKVNEMKAQRSQFHADLRIAVNSDDITAKVIAHGSKEGLQMLFDRELGKHERLTQLIDQNLLAQKNILQALTESYAKAAPVLKTLSDVKHKRDTFFSSLAASYDVYEDLLAKSAKGLEFYKKLAGNVQKLLTRFKSARDVQSEERQQRLKNVTKTTNTPAPKDHSSITSNAPKLRDYLKTKSANSSASAGNTDPTAAFPGAPAATPYIPPIRPNPLGSENPAQAACNSSYYPTAVPVGAQAQPVAPTSSAPNEPPPPYSLQQPQFYDPNAAGYTNPMYQQQQQNIAPPAYSMQASPNSQFMSMSTDMTNMSLQSNYVNFGTVPQSYANTGNLSTPPQMLPNTAPAHSQSYGNTSNLPQQNMYPVNVPQQLQQASTYPTQSYSPAPTPNVYTAPHQMQTQPVAPQMQSQAAWNTNKAIGSPASNQYSNMYDPNVGPGVSLYQQQQQPFMNSPQATATPGTNYQQQQSQQLNSIQQSQPPLQQQQQQLQQQQPLQQQPQLPIPPQQQFAIPPQQSQALQQQQSMQQQSIQQQSMNPNYSTISSSIPSTEPLYVTTTSDVTPLPATLQAPYVVNAVQTSLPTNTSAIPSVVSSTASTLPPFSPYTITTKHPGYTFNTETGAYDYNSGYHQASPINSQFYGQYTSPSLYQMAQQAGNNSHTTDSETASKLTVATGRDNPIISHTQNAPHALEQQLPTSKNDVSYYNAPYGYQSNGVSQFPNNNATPKVLDPTQVQPSAIYPAPLHQNMQQTGQHSIYIQSGRSQPTTQTTKSIEYTQSPQASPAPAVTPAPGTPKPATIKPSATPSTKKSTNIDLLTDIDLSGSGVGAPPPILPEPVLKPQVVTSPPASQVAASTSSPIKDAKGKLNGGPEKDDQPTATPPPSVPPLIPTLSSIPLQLASPVDSPAARKSSCDNISIGSDLSSLDHNFDWDSVSMRSEKPLSANDVSAEKHSTFLLKPNDPFVDDKTLKYFHKEVERYEKTIETLNVKMLNGSTPLSSKWKELQDLLAKESSKRTTTIARLFPEKNRSLDCLPYDHARVTLEKNTDDYINAAFIRNLGPSCPNFIIAQTPQQNTINDFWSMIYSQKARTVICLHTPNEMLDPFWPQELDSEMHFDDYSVRVIKTISLSHCSEFSLRLSMHGSDAIIDLSLLQIKTWAKRSPNQAIGIARNVLLAHQQRCLEFNSPAAPLIMNCLTGSERSELVAIAICAILATQTKRPLLINVVDVWYRICSQRQNALRDTQTLEESMQIVLNHAHDVLNKRGIMTSYQMKIAPQVASKEKEEIKDPLNELDPLWKLKQK